eukprot:CAMPEP_0119005898 /NCGR_PEP_ID=MMETSP1176-20130426/1992_1 /TAXON_ID=265551 /ORGANISM="Synedropsis recta cf, Strain CCMP1620" /LENGTH=839 /DNA_ID=CAMNT_0006957757 /DNA_START=70 /DNA_END=2592 /DNA_ORIENTATION=-
MNVTAAPRAIYFFLLVIGFFQTVDVDAAVIQVTAVGTGPGDDTANIKAAVATANDNDIIELTGIFQNVQDIVIKGGKILTLQGKPTDGVPATLKGVNGGSTNSIIVVSDSNTNVSLIDLVLTENKGDYGGAIVVEYSTLSLKRVSITNNSASYGGAIYNDQGTITMSHSTFSNNSASVSGGAIYNSLGTISMTHCSIFQEDDGTVLGDDNPASFVVTNSLMSNTGTGGSICKSTTTITDGGFNLFDDSTCGNSNLDNTFATEEFLGPLANNGGSTLTRALLAGSPAISAADPSTCPFIDQRGFISPSCHACDIGAVEFDAVGGGCQDITITQSTSIIASDVYDGTFDDCNKTLDFAVDNSGPFNDVGTHQVVLTVTDKASNSATSCTSKVLVVVFSFCPKDYFEPSHSNPFDCEVSDNATITDQDAETYCKYLPSTSSTPIRALSSGRRRGLRKSRQLLCDAGTTYDSAERFCAPVDECTTGEHSCPMDGSFCVDYFAPFRYKCQCLPDYKPTGFPLATTTVSLHGETVEAFVETVVSESGHVNNYTLPIAFRPAGCEFIPSNAPSAVVSNPPSSPALLVEETSFECGNFGRPCTAVSEYCGEYMVDQQAGTTAMACLCKVGWEKALADPPQSLRGCTMTDKCASPEWNDCDPDHATCSDPFPGTFEPVQCQCNSDYSGGGRDCLKKTPSPVSPAPTLEPTTRAPVVSIITDTVNTGGGGGCPSCSNDCGKGTADGCANCACTCDSGAVLVDGACLLPRPGSNFNNVNTTCEFTACSFATGYIQVSVVNTSETTSETCMSITHDGCNTTCAENNCDGNFDAGGSNGTSWEDPYVCATTV